MSGYARARPSGHWVDFPSTTYGVVTAADFEQWDEKIYELAESSVSPKDYGAAGDGSTDDSSSFASMFSDISIRTIIDLGGASFYTPTTPTCSTSLTTIINGRMIGNTQPALYIAADDVSAVNCTFQRSVSQHLSTDTLSQRACVSVNGKRFRSLNCNYTDANQSLLYLTNGSCEGAFIQGGYWQNSSSHQDSCFVYAASGASTNERVTIQNIYGQGTGCSSGILLFDSSRAKIIGNILRDLASPPDLTWTSGWTNTSGNIWSRSDRTDGITRVVFNNGVQVTSENTASPTAPTSNQWGVSAGFVYLNLGGVDPNTRTIVSRINGGYGIGIYSTGVGASMDENRIAYNEVTNTDGFGCYWQLSATDARNTGIGNVYNNVCRLGLENANLPFAGVSVSRGLDTTLVGEHIHTCGYHGFYMANGATGRSVGCYVDSAAQSGFNINTSNWTCSNDEARGNTRHGFSILTSPSQTITGVQLVGCRSSGNTLDGVTVDNASGTDIKASVIGGVYYSNTQRGISMNIVSDSKIIGATAHDNSTSVPQIRVSGASARVTVDDNTVYGSTGTGIEVKSTVTSAIVGANRCNTTTPFNLEPTVQTAGSAVPVYVGTGSPETVVTAPVGSMYQRRDGGALTSLYMKESGTGNTGWIAK